MIGISDRGDKMLDNNKTMVKKCSIKLSFININHIYLIIKNLIWQKIISFNKFVVIIDGINFEF